MAIGGINVGQELLNVPMGEMIRSMAMAIADAQVRLDTASAANAEMMSGKHFLRDPDTGQIVDKSKPIDSTVFFGGENVSMMELGFTPTFYQFIDTIIEVKISINMTHSTEVNVTAKGRSKKITATVATVSAGFSSKYGYSVEGASLLRTKLAPVPPPGILEDRVRALMAKQAGG